ncbi:MAG TPA: hypothetical protein VGR28_11205 [Candidatus Thermoplasmatota archaeon]|jgi:hypothetical protein|nr:hypothetical protein [Candidatus Thermoplasmatota archaeon]
MAKFAIVALGLTGFLLLAGAAAAETYIEVPVNSPAMGPSADLPATTLSGTPAITLRVPSITVPSACNATPCSQPTQLPSGTIATPTLDAVPVGVSALEVERTCAPENLACANGLSLPAQQLAETPAIPSSEADVPATELPALCTLSDTPCFGAIAYPGFAILMPARGPTVIAPPLSLTVWVPGLAGGLPLGPPSIGALDPTPVAIGVPFVGDVGFTLCETPCPAPDVGPVPIDRQGPAGATIAPDGEPMAIML